MNTIPSPYVAVALQPGERVLAQARVSPWSILPGTLAALIVLYVTSAFGIAWLAAPFALAYIVPPVLRWSTTELAVTNRHFMAKHGLIGRDAVEMKLTQIESVLVRQGVWGRLLGFGAVVVNGTGNTRAVIRNVDAPLRFKRAVSDAAIVAQTR